MKKFMMMAAAVVMTAVSFTACNGGGSSNLSDDADSLAYNLGVAQSASLKQYMTMQLGVDSAYVDEFLKGIKEGATSEGSEKKIAYMRGLEVGKQIQDMAKGLSNEVYGDDTTKTVNVNVLIAGFADGLKGKAKMTPEEAMAQFQAKMEPIHEANMDKKYGENRRAGEKYLADNAKKEGVKVLPSGVQYKVLAAGSGDAPADTAKVSVLYEGKLIDGTIFDSTAQRGDEPFEVDLAMPRVIEGWAEILKLMPVGAKWEVVIPQDKAYGAQEMGQIQPFSTLIFTIERQK